MKKQDNYRRAVQRLSTIFNLANADYFNNELPETTVTIQESQRAYGHCSISKVWNNHAKLPIQRAFTELAARFTLYRTAYRYRYTWKRPPTIEPPSYSPCRSL